MRNKICLIVFLLTASCGSSSSSDLAIIGGHKAPNEQGIKGVYPATIGFITANANGCTGTRIGQTTFISAAHCLKGVNAETNLVVYASNSKRFDLVISNVRVHSTWAAGARYKSDIAVFDVRYSTLEQVIDLNSFVDIAPLSHQTPNIGSAVNLAGFGCAQKTGLSSSSCDVKTGFYFMKTARNRIIDNNAFLSPGNHRSFQLDGSSNKDGIDGFIEEGDSGGPVYTLSNELLGVNTATNNGILTGNDGILIWTEHAWIGFDDVRSWLSTILGAESKTPKYLPENTFITYRYKNGDLYGGRVKSGLRNGNGSMGYADGRSYTGNWVDDKRAGYGEQTFPSGSMYVSYRGRWDSDKFHGIGTMVYSSGLIYSGEHANGKIHGEGQMTYQNGDVRRGKFFNGKREGEFVLVTKSGSMFRENFSSDVRVSSEKVN